MITYCKQIASCYDDFYLTTTKFAVTVVPATSTLIDSSTTRVPDVLRASVFYTNTNQEIDLFCIRLRELLQTLQKKYFLHGRNLAVPDRPAMLRCRVCPRRIVRRAGCRRQRGYLR